MGQQHSFHYQNKHLNCKNADDSDDEGEGSRRFCRCCCDSEYGRKQPEDYVTGSFTRDHILKIAYRSKHANGPVINRLTVDVRNDYIIGKELGHGQFGKTYLCTERKSDRRFACKTILKETLITRYDVDDVRREIQILHHVVGQPNIIELKAAYEDQNAVHLITELCEGGELFDRIIRKGKYSESGAAALCRTIIEVVERCHSLGVMHRDLKPENFLFSTQSEDSPLVCIDFGLSVFFEPGQVFRDLVGSAYYIAPEVLRRKYGPEADVWSAGVILYILLSGFPPFWAETEQDIFKAILVGKIDFEAEPWPHISEGAKDLIKKMLEPNPKKRIPAHAVLNHSWIRVDGEASDKPLDSVVLTRLKQFRDMNKLKKLALQVIAKELSEEEITGLKVIFESMDTDHSGFITFDKLKEGLARQGACLAENEVQELLDAADLDKSGTIDYAEFIGATIHMSKANKEKRLHSAFLYFDKDNSGFITVDELEQALKEHHIKDKTAIKDIIAEVDTDHDGKIDYREFVAMMRKGNPQTRAFK